MHFKWNQGFIQCNDLLTVVCMSCECLAMPQKIIRKSTFTMVWHSVLFITLAEEALCKGDFALHKLDIQTYTGLLSSVDIHDKF